MFFLVYLLLFGFNVGLVVVVGYLSRLALGLNEMMVATGVGESWDRVSWVVAVSSVHAAAFVIFLGVTKASSLL